MRAFLPFLIAACLFLLSFGAQASTRPDAAAGLGPGQIRVGPLVCSMAAVAAVAASAVSSDEDGSRIVAPGDDGIHADDDLVEAASHPGYCNIWSADLLDPPDVLDEIEESSALFALPTAPLELPSGDVSPPRHGRAPPLPAALFKPPIVTA